MNGGSDWNGSFGDWLRRRRKALDLTQEQLAERASCSHFTIRKIEADERRPSRALALRLVERLALPADTRAAFLAAARAERRTPRPAPFPSPPIAAPAPVPLDALPFVGRQRELDQLAAVLTTASSPVVLLEGEPGIGKSRLSAEFSRRAQASGVQVFATRCYEIEHSMPYQPIIELASAAFAPAGITAPPALSPLVLAELAALLPVVAAHAVALPAPPPALPEARQARLFHALEQLFEARAAQGRLLLVIDDFHWIDSASLQFVHAFARHLAHRGVLMLLAYRDEEILASRQVVTFLDAVRRDHQAVLLTLGRLAAPDTAAMVQAAGKPFHDPRVGAWLHAQTEGHPFFLVSMLQSLADRQAPIDPETAESHEVPALPDALRRAVRARLAPLTPAAREVLEPAAVLGRRFEFDRLRTVTGLAAPALLTLVDTLTARHLLREVAAGVYDFSHDKIREAVYSDIGATRRLLLHRVVAETLEAGAGAALDEQAPHLAEHYTRAQVWTKGFEYLLAAASRAQRLYATHEALRLLDRALDLLAAHPEAAPPATQLDVVEQRGLMRAQAGLPDAAVADFDRVLAAARAHGDARKARDTLILLGMAYRRSDRYACATACLTEALAASREMHDQVAVADTLYHLGTVAWSSGHNVDAIRHHEEAVALCTRHALTGLPAVQAFHGLGEARFADAKPLLAIEAFTRSLVLARELGDRSYEAENLMMLGWACIGSMGLGDYPRAIESLDAGLEIAQAAGLGWHLGPLQIAREHALACSGRFGEAWHHLTDLLQRLEASRHSRYRLMGCNMLGHLLLDLGLTAPALGAFDRALTIARDTEMTYWVPLLTANRAIARMQQGDLAVADALLDARARALANRETWCLPRIHEGLADLALRRGELEEGLQHAEALHALGARGALAEVIARAQRWRGEALIDRDPAAAFEALQTALTASTSIGAVRVTWDVHRALQRLAERRGRTEEAAHHAAAARVIVDAMRESLRDTPLMPALPD